MFLISELEDTVKIAPEDFKKETVNTIQDELNEKYSNKVVQEVGHVVCVYDVLGLSEGFILYLDDCSYIKGEILVGKIKSCSFDGVVVSLGFFDDILIPRGALQLGSKFDHEEQIWIWHYEGEKLFMDIEEPIRVRVLNERFTDITPTKYSDYIISGRKASDRNIDLAANSTKVPPYSITCTIQEDGLGLMSWWGSRA